MDGGYTRRISTGRTGLPYVRTATRRRLHNSPTTVLRNASQQADTVFWGARTALRAASSCAIHPDGRAPAVPAPRIAPAAASAVRTALQQLATAQATTMVQVLHEALQCDARWAALVAAVRRSTTTAALSECALAVLRYQRGKFIFADESSHNKMVLNLLRVLRRRGPEAPNLQSVGVPCTPSTAGRRPSWTGSTPSRPES